MQSLHYIDIKSFWQLVKGHKRIYIIGEILAAAIGLVIGFSTPRTYQSTLKLAPETNSSSMGTLGSISSLMGMNMANMGNEDAILPEFYPDVKSSPDFVLGLYNIQVTTVDGKVKTSLKDYLLNYCKTPWWDELFIKLFKSNDSDGKTAKGLKTPGIINLSRSQYKFMKWVEGSISCDVDKKTGVITIGAIAQDPLVATIIADSVRARLQDFITDYRTSKARNDVVYFEKCYADADKEYKKAAQKYASYSDSHQDLSLESYQVENDNLENQMQNAFNIRSEYATKLELAKAKVLERTPVYTIIQAPIVPVKHIAPRRSKILALWLVIGFVVCSAIAYRKSGKGIFKKVPLKESKNTVKEIEK